VRRMLLTARAYAEGGRALSMYTALRLDTLISTDDADERADADSQKCPHDVTPFGVSAQVMQGIVVRRTPRRIRDGADPLYA